MQICSGDGRGTELHRYQRATPGALARGTARTVAAIGLAIAAVGGVLLALGMTGPGGGAIAVGVLVALMVAGRALGDGVDRNAQQVVVKEHVLVVAFRDRTETLPWSEVEGVTLVSIAGSPSSMHIRTGRGTWDVAMMRVPLAVAQRLESEIRQRLP